MASLLRISIAACALSACITDLNQFPSGNVELPSLHSGERWSAEGHSAELTRTEDGTLVLVTDIPRLPADGDDADGDGLSDSWEDALLHRLRPAIRLHPTEPMLEDATSDVAMAGRVVQGPESDHYRVFIAIAYDRDYGSCGVHPHRGDVERVALDLVALDSAGGRLAIAGAYTAGHEYTSFDSSQLFLESALSELETLTDPITNQLRWVVYASSGKHATYATPRRCQLHTSTVCVKEACAPSDGGGFFPLEPHLELLPTIENVGEPRVATPCPELCYMEFADLIWADQPFCGLGLTGGGELCTSPAGDKLTRDPFQEGHPDI